jgi:hypothetical protein
MAYATPRRRECAPDAQAIRESVGEVSICPSVPLGPQATSFTRLCFYCRYLYQRIAISINEIATATYVVVLARDRGEYS